MGHYRNVGGSHTHQIAKKIFRNCNIKEKFLPNSTATTWNLLTPYVVNAPQTVNGYKSKLDAHMALGSLRRLVKQISNQLMKSQLLRLLLILVRMTKNKSKKFIIKQCVYLQNDAIIVENTKLRCGSIEKSSNHCQSN